MIKLTQQLPIKYNTFHQNKNKKHQKQTNKKTVYQLKIP